MCRDSRVLFAVVANAMMSLGAFLAVILGDITFAQVVGGAAVGFLASVPIYRFIAAAECGDETEADMPDWYDLDDRSEAFAAGRRLLSL